jgi:cyclohexadienyl dehydratase
MDRRELAQIMGLGLIGGTAALVAPQTAQAQQAARSRLHQALERGTLRVGTTGDFNPMSFRDTGSNTYQGFDIEAMTTLTTEMGLRVEWVATEWAQLVAGIAANRYDIFSGASVNVARARTAAFTIPYYEAGTVPLALRAQAGRFTSWNAINADGVRVAVSMGTVFDEQARQHFPRAQIRAVQAPATGFQEVLAGRADITITSNVEASTLTRRFEQLTLLGSDVQPRNKRPFAYVVAQDDPTWLNFLNTWITLKKYEGLFDSLEARWLPRS